MGKDDPPLRCSFYCLINNRFTLDIVPSSKQFLTSLRAAARSEPVKEFMVLEQRLESHIGFSFTREDSHTMGFESRSKALVVGEVH